MKKLIMIIAILYSCNIINAQSVRTVFGYYHTKEANYIIRYDYIEEDSTFADILQGKQLVNVVVWRHVDSVVTTLSTFMTTYESYDRHPRFNDSLMVSFAYKTLSSTKRKPDAKIKNKKS